jgi:hypothetical protein
MANTFSATQAGVKILGFQLPTLTIEVSVFIIAILNLFAKLVIISQFNTHFKRFNVF